MGTGLEHAPEAIPDHDQNGRVDLTYENDAGTVRIHRTWLKLGDIVREYDVESIYNYTEERWGISHRLVHDYDLADDGETLAGDGSAWRGTGRYWKDWARMRHVERLRLRFPRDDIQDDEGEVTA